MRIMVQTAEQTEVWLSSLFPYVFSFKDFQECFVQVLTKITREEYKKKENQ